MKLLRPGDHVILLDEHGKEYRSVDFATKLNKLWSNSARRIVFIIGGPYGFSQKPVDAANESISLSKMTFSPPNGKAHFRGTTLSRTHDIEP